MVKLSALLFFTVLAVRLLSSQSAKSSPVVEAPAMNGTKELIRSNVNHAVDVPYKENGNANSVQESTTSLRGNEFRICLAQLTNEACDFIESQQDCTTNGRPYTGYLYCRWSPRDCEPPQFDLRSFLEFMRNKAWAFIADSISRNPG